MEGLLRASQRTADGQKLRQRHSLLLLRWWILKAWCFISLQVLSRRRSRSTAWCSARQCNRKGRRNQHQYPIKTDLQELRNIPKADESVLHLDVNHDYRLQFFVLYIHLSSYCVYWISHQDWGEQTGLHDHHHLPHHWHDHPSDAHWNELYWVWHRYF